MKSCIVTCADEAFFPLLNELLGSLEQALIPESRDMIVLDLGLREDQREKLNQNYPFSVQCMRPDWHKVPFKDAAAIAASKEAYLCKPFLPDMLPGYDCYTWIDSDVWFQDTTAIDQFENEALNGNLAICSHTDRCYNNHHKVKTVELGPFCLPYKVTSHFYNRLKDFFGRKIAARYGFQHMFNTGLVSLRSDAPHWRSWQGVLSEANLQKQRKRTQLCDQTLLTFATYRDQLPIQVFPATHNWLVRHATPMYNRKKGCLVAPYMPHESISVVHLAAVRDKHAPRRLSLLHAQNDSETIESPLTWSAIQHLNAETTRRE